MVSETEERPECDNAGCHGFFSEFHVFALICVATWSQLYLVPTSLMQEQRLAHAYISQSICVVHE